MTNMSKDIQNQLVNFNYAKSPNFISNFGGGGFTTKTT